MPTVGAMVDAAVAVMAEAIVAERPEDLTAPTLARIAQIGADDLLRQLAQAEVPDLGDGVRDLVSELFGCLLGFAMGALHAQAATLRAQGAARDDGAPVGPVH